MTPNYTDKKHENLTCHACARKVKDMERKNLELVDNRYKCIDCLESDNGFLPFDCLTIHDRDTGDMLDSEIFVTVEEGARILARISKPLTKEEWLDVGQQASSVEAMEPFPEYLQHKALPSLAIYAAHATTVAALCYWIANNYEDIDQ